MASTAKPEPERRAEAPGLVIVEERGNVLALNRTARRLLGDGVDRPCWDVVGSMPDAEGLPCTPGCVREMLKGGLNEARHTPIRVKGQRYALTCIPARDVGVCVLSAGDGQSAQPWQMLTAREVEVLRLVADGATTSEVAARLEISPATARTHVENMRTKLGVATRAGLVALGFRLGYLD
jgi:DNA-binding CsgD family transcriptional regulator